MILFVTAFSGWLMVTGRPLEAIWALLAILPVEMTYYIHLYNRTKNEVPSLTIEK